MCRFRYAAASLLALGLMAGCSELSEPLTPVAAAGEIDSRPACRITDDPGAKLRSVTTGCGNSTVTVPKGWVLRVDGGAKLGEEGGRAQTSAVHPLFTAIEFPDSAYLAQTRLIGLSHFDEFQFVVVVDDGIQRVDLGHPTVKRSVPGSWPSWSCPPHSETCTPHVLESWGATSFELALQVPSTVFGFEVAPEPFDAFTFTAHFYSEGVLVGSVTRTVSGDGGARLFAATADGVTFDRVVLSGPTEFAIAQLRYAVQEPTPPIGVEIAAAYSGDPRRPPGTLVLDDEFVYVEILDVEQHLGRSASASDVRIGPNFVAGTPADSFQLLDLNRDGVRDIRLRWSLRRLVDEGRLHPSTTELHVWGLDPLTSDRFHGIAAVQVASGWVVLHDNGGFITHPGAGAGGADIHLSHTPFVFLAGAHFVSPGPYFRVADRFTVTGGGWSVSQLVTRATQRFVTTPVWTHFRANIWNGRPGDSGSTIVASTTSANVVWSGAYGIRNSLPMGETEWPIFDVYWDTPGLTLADGEYWIDWQIEGSDAWTIFVTLPNPADPGRPLLPEGVARHLTPAGWLNILQGGQFPPPHTPATPFLVVGRPVAQ